MEKNYKKGLQNKISIFSNHISRKITKRGS